MIRAYINLSIGRRRFSAYVRLRRTSLVANTNTCFVTATSAVVKMAKCRNKRESIAVTVSLKQDRVKIGNHKVASFYCQQKRKRIH